MANVDTSNFFYNGRCLTESKAIANAFNKYFVNVATDIQFFIRYSNNNFHDLFHPIRINCFWSTPLIKLKSKIWYCPLILQNLSVQRVFQIVTLVYKKASNLKCSNYRTIFLLSNIDKALEMYNCTLPLKLGFRQK